METSLRDTLNRAQTNSWQDYVSVTKQMSASEPETSEIPRGLTDDEELRRMGMSDAAEETYKLLMGIDS